EIRFIGPPLYVATRERFVEAGVKAASPGGRERGIVSAKKGVHAMGQLILTLLGGFRARLDSGAPVALPTRKAQALLAYLAVPLGTAHPRDKLASLLGANTLERTARPSLRQTWYALGKSLRDVHPSPFLVDGETVALDPAAVTIDVHEFQKRAAEATPSASAEASALYQGDFLEGLVVQEQPFEDWLLGHRERLHELAVKSLPGLLRHQRTAGSADLAIQSALRLLELDPLQEPVHRVLMQLYVDSGRRGSALRQYQFCVATLQRELRTEPEAETKALYHEILRQRARAMSDQAGQPMEAVRAQPGSYQTPSIEPPPAWEPPLVGREREVAQLLEALDGAFSGRASFAVLVGEAGSGKSRLVGELVAATARRGGRVLV